MFLVIYSVRTKYVPHKYQVCTQLVPNTKPDNQVLTL